MVKLDDLDFIRFCYEKHKVVSALPSSRINYMDLTFCISGSMHYLFEGKHVFLKPGDAIIFPQGSVRTRYESDIPSLYCSFNVTMSDGFESKVKGYLKNSLRSDTVAIIESVRNSFNSVSDERLEKCVALFWYLYYQLIETVVNNEHPHIKHIKQYVAKHISEEISLEDISEHVHLSPQYCCALFSKHMGQTLFDFITKQRIDYAKGLIITSELSLTEIASSCGFNDYNYFSRVFKNTTGITASKYRSLNKGKYMI